MADKNFKTIEEQIEILRSRGLTINNEPQARDFLLHNNYHFSPTKPSTKRLSTRQISKRLNAFLMRPI